MEWLADVRVLAHTQIYIIAHHIGTNASAHAASRLLGNEVCNEG
jgi:hypothetical protein